MPLLARDQSVSGIVASVFRTIGQSHMRQVLLQTARGRKGVAAVMFGLMLPVLISLASLAVDTAMIAVARGHLSRAADAAALAGAQQLLTEARLREATDLTTEITAANSQALAFAQHNMVLGSAPVLSTNISNETGGDMLVGYLDPDDTSSTLNSSSELTSLFNSVQVTLRRDATHGGAVPTFLAQIMGFNGCNVTVTSTATAQAFSVNGFKASGSAN